MQHDDLPLPPDAEFLSPEIERSSTRRWTKQQVEYNIKLSRSLEAEAAQKHPRLADAQKLIDSLR